MEALDKVGVAVGEAGGGQDAECDGAVHAVEDPPVVRVGLDGLEPLPRHQVECVLLADAGIAPQSGVPLVQKLARALAVPKEHQACSHKDTSHFGQRCEMT